MNKNERKKKESDCHLCKSCQKEKMVGQALRELIVIQNYLVQKDS